MITWDSVKKNLKSLTPDEKKAIEEKVKLSVLASDEKIEKYLK